MPEPIMRIVGAGERKLAKRISFTIANLNAAHCSNDKGRLWLYDARCPGLAFMLTSGGAKSFYVYRKVKGRPQRIRLGGFPDISIEQARKLAAQTTADISKGIDPQQRKRAARAEMTLGELWEWFLESHAKPHKRSWEKDQERYNKHLSGWASRRLSAITRQEVQTLHAKIGKDAPGASNRVLALLSTMFNKGRLIGYEAPNPVDGVERFREVSRERYLTPTELPKFLGALEAEPDQTWRDFFGLCLWTGARSGNVKSMEWSEVDRTAGTWTIPPAKAKAGRPLTVHLPTPALKIIKDRHAKRGNNPSPYVFPSHGESGHIAEPKTAWEVILERAGITDLWIHDLRRTHGSYQAATGASLQVIGKSLGHSNVATTAIYSRLNLDPVRESVNKSTKAMLATMKKK